MTEKDKNTLILAVCVAVFIGANIVLFITGHFPSRTGGVPDWGQTLGLMAAALMSFAMFSFLYRDNPIFRAVENLFVGLGLGVTLYVMWYLNLKPEVYDRLISPMLDPSVDVPGADLVLIIPVLMGVMMLTRLSGRHGWISRYPIAFLVGYGSGFSIQPMIHSLILKQVEKTIVPVQMSAAAWGLCALVAAVAVVGAYAASKGGRLAVGLKIAAAAVALAYVIAANTPSLNARPQLAEAFRAVDLLLIVLGVLCVLCYFFFSAEHKGALGAASRVGIIFLMVAFGATFGYTVMARESLVIGRIQFLLGDWLGLL